MANFIMKFKQLHYMERVLFREFEIKNCPEGSLYK